MSENISSAEPGSITEFIGDYAFLSNNFIVPRGIYISPDVLPETRIRAVTVEQAYRASSLAHGEHQIEVLELKDAVDATARALELIRQDAANEVQG